MFQSYSKIISKNNKTKKYKIFIRIFFIILLLILLLLILLNNFNFLDGTNYFYFDKFETFVYDNIKETLLKSRCSLMWNNQREFINGIIRKFKPKKILELGVNLGGGSIIILNAIRDIKFSHLYSIDISNSSRIGRCVTNIFPYLANKWTLFKGNIAAKYMKDIGKNIDLAIVDTSHFEPGEILDFLLILPFFKDEAIIIIHDIDHQITSSKGKDMRYYWAPYIIFNLIRGKKFYPSGQGVLNKDIGAIKLEKNQKRFIHDYCRALGGHWEYFPSEEHIQIIKDFFKKYYDKECLIILNEAISFNRDFVRDNPKEYFYARSSKKNKETFIKVKNKTMSAH